jgi:hypothetical protein
MIRCCIDDLRTITAVTDLYGRSIRLSNDFNFSESHISDGVCFHFKDLH